MYISTGMLCIHAQLHVWMLGSRGRKYFQTLRKKKNF